MASHKAHLPNCTSKSASTSPTRAAKEQKKHTHENELDQIRGCAFIWQVLSSVVKINLLYQRCFHCSAQTSSAKSISVYCKESVSQQLLWIQSHFSLILLFLHLSETLVSCYFYSVLKPDSDRLREAGQPWETPGRAGPPLASCFPAKQFVHTVAEIMKVCRHIKKSISSPWKREPPGFAHMPAPARFGQAGAGETEDKVSSFACPAPPHGTGSAPLQCSKTGAASAAPPLYCCLGLGQRGTGCSCPLLLKTAPKNPPWALWVTGWEPGPTAPGSLPALLHFAPPTRRCLFCIRDGEGVYFAPCTWQHCPAALPAPCFAVLSGVLQTTPQQSSVLRGPQLTHGPGAAAHSYGGADHPPILTACPECAINK